MIKYPLDVVLNKILVVSLTCLLLSSCADTTNGDTTGSDSTSPIAYILSPADGTANIDVTADLNVIFSEDMFATTIDSSSFSLTKSSEIDSDVSFDAIYNIATLNPTNDLSLLTTYTANLSNAMTDLSGNALTMESWSFTTRDGEWGAGELIENDDLGNAGEPQVVFDTFGNALVVWVQNDGTQDNILSNRYSVDTGWGTPELLETDDTGNASSPQITIDASGNALAVWYQLDSSSKNNIYSNRYVAGSGWTTAELVETNDVGHASNPQVAFDESGIALAVWAQGDGVQDDIWSNRYVEGTGWGTPVLIESTDAGDAANPQIVFDTSNNAFVVWHQNDGVQYDIWSNRYDSSEGWGVAEKIETDDAGSAADPQIAIDSSNNALVVWSQYDGTRNNIWSNRYVVGTGWNTAELIENDNDGPANTPQIAADEFGNALVVWSQSDSTYYHIWSNRYVSGSSWGTAEIIDTVVGHAYNPQVATDASGNALVIWNQDDGVSYNIYVKRFVLGSGWNEEEHAEVYNSGSASSPQIVIDISGNSLTVWRQSEGPRYSLWSNRFD